MGYLLGFTLLLTGAYAAIADANENLAHKPGSKVSESPITVIYPDSGEPYRTAVMQITGGIEDKTKTRIPSYSPGSNSDIGALKNNLRKQNAKVVIALADVAPKPESNSADSPIAVIYPDIGEPYRTVFMQIISGIEDKAKTRIPSYPLGSNADIEAVKNTLHQQNAKVVIALGRVGVNIAANLDRNIGVVVGGVITPPDNQRQDVPVNSLTPDPALLFSNLKGLMPAVRRVITVYDPRLNGWLMRLAKEAARAQGLELAAYEAPDLRAAVLLYRDIFATADSRQDALWLLQDSTTVEDSLVLPLVLQESWNRNLLVFSSRFDHVRRGVLFSLHPDNIELGRHLAGAALGFLASGNYGEHGMILLREVQMAINLRTAKHLEVNINPQQNFGLVFPEQ
jgi:putative ABC transport system substrate-binding protein